MHRVTGPQLVLGTVQIGLPYGVANQTGLPDAAEAVNILHAAADAGVTVIDTARAYGDAENRIGRALGLRPGVEFVTKLHPLPHVKWDASSDTAVAAASQSLSQSLASLRRDHVETLLLHRASHRTAWGGAVWDYLQEQVLEGRVGRLGVSVQSPAELLEALTDSAVSHIQLPYNILDHRWDATGCVAALAVRSDVVVHTRSTYLQGLLADPYGARWPTVPGLSTSNLLERLHLARETLGAASIRDLALRFVRANRWIDGVVIGIEGRRQLAENVADFARAPGDGIDRDAIIRVLGVQPEALLDPSMWPEPER